MSSRTFGVAVALSVVLFAFGSAAASEIPPLVRPALTFSTYLGGAQDDTAVGVALDRLRNIYIAGTTASANFPTGSTDQHPRPAGTNIFVVKISADGANLLYSRVIGGSSVDMALGIAVDSTGNAYVLGRTTSTDFPTVNPLQAVHGGGIDAVVLKLSPTGDILYSTYLGGSGDEPFAPSSHEGPRSYGNPIAVDPAGNVFLTGMTTSTNFPVASAMQPELKRFLGLETYGIDAFVTKISPTGDALIYSTYLGGAGFDFGHGVAVDRQGHAYVTGSTTGDFPTRNALYPSYQGGQLDAFLCKLAADGETLVYSTYLGGGGFSDRSDIGTAVAIDSVGAAYVAGITSSEDFPTVNAAQPSIGGGRGLTVAFSDGFLAKVDPTGSRLVYSTYLGGYADGWNDTSGDIISGVAVDASGAACVTGISGSVDFPLLWPLAETAQQKLGAFVTRFSPVGGISFSTALGHYSSGAAVALDTAGNVYAVGAVRWPVLPVGQGLQPVFGGATDAFLVKIGSRDGLAVEFSSPADGSVFPVGTAIELSVRTTAGSAALARVHYYAGSLLIGTSTNPPFGSSWSSSIPATFALTAVVTDALGQQISTARPLSISFTNGGPAFPSYTLEPLQEAGGEVTAAAINNLGQVTGWIRYISRWDTYSAFLWEDGVLSPWKIHDFTGGRSINENSEVVGVATPGLFSQDPHKAALINGKTVTYLASTNVPFANLSIFGELLDNNNLGQAVGYGRLTQYDYGQANTFAFLWDNGSVRVFPALGDASAAALAINDQGQAVGCSYVGTLGVGRVWSWVSGFPELAAVPLVALPLMANPPPPLPRYSGRAVLWESRLATDMNTLLPANSGWHLSVATDINSAGQIIGLGLKDGKPNAFLFDRGNVTALSLPGDTNCYPSAINDHGQIVGTSNGAAFLWQNGQGIDLNALLPPNTGWVLLSAAGINNRAQIVGQDSQGGYVLTPKPAFRLAVGQAQGASSGEFQLSVVAPLGQTVVLQVSADMRTWQPIATNKAAASPWILTPPSAGRGNCRFYRAVLRP